MLQLEAPVIRRDSLVAGRACIWLSAPEIATRARPGPLLAIRAAASPLEPLLREALPIAAADTASGTVMLLRHRETPAGPGRYAGETLDLLGPIGRGWAIDERTRNVLLLGTEAGVGALLFLARVAGKRACNVALLVGGAEGDPALPTLLVPEAVEYQSARGPAHPLGAAEAALGLLDSTLLRWADALYTTLPVDVYPALAAQIRSTRMRWEPGFAQGMLIPPMACFTGICDTCLVPESRRAWRACVDGPQCDVRDFVR